MTIGDKLKVKIHTDFICEYDDVAVFVAFIDNRFIGIYTISLDGE